MGNIPQTLLNAATSIVRVFITYNFTFIKILENYNNNCRKQRNLNLIINISYVIFLPKEIYFFNLKLCFLVLQLVRNYNLLDTQGLNNILPFAMRQINLILKDLLIGIVGFPLFFFITNPLTQPGNALWNDLQLIAILCVLTQIKTLLIYNVSN